jgi:hypothetical protein
VSSDATQFRLIEKIFSIHGRNAFRAIQRAGCDICSTQWTTGVCLGDRRNICDQISALCQAAPGLSQSSWKRCELRLLRSALPENLGRLFRVRRNCSAPCPCRVASLRSGAPGGSADQGSLGEDRFEMHLVPLVSNPDSKVVLLMSNVNNNLSDRRSYSWFSAHRTCFLY